MATINLYETSSQTPFAKLSPLYKFEIPIKILTKFTASIDPMRGNDPYYKGGETSSVFSYMYAGLIKTKSKLNLV